LKENHVTCFIFDVFPSVRFWTGGGTNFLYMPMRNSIVCKIFSCKLWFHLWQIRQERR